MRQAMSTPTAYGITAPSQRQHAADRQAVADVRVGHQRRADGDRHLAGLPHLDVGGLVDVAAPGAIADRLMDHGRLGRQQLSRELAPDRIGLECPRIPHDVGHDLPRPLPLEPHAGPLLRRPPQRDNRRLGAIRRHAEFL